MKKEVWIAIIIGIAIGLIFTYGIYVANNSLKSAPVAKITQTTTPGVNATPTPLPTPSSKYSLSNFSNYLLTKNRNVTLSGSRDPGEAVVVLGESTEYILPASTSGQFSLTLPLDTGYNRIQVIWLNSNIHQNVLATYSTASDLFTSVTPTVSPITSSSESAIRDSVQAKVNQAIAEIKKNTSKKAYLGQIASVSEASLTINNIDSTSFPITVTAETTVKLKDNSEGSLKDLKKNDFILAMGDADASGNLLAKRLLVVPAPDKDYRQIVTGTVSAFTNKTLTVNGTSLPISRSTVFQPSKYKFKDVDPGFKVIAIFDPPSTTPLLYVVSEK